MTNSPPKRRSLVFDALSILVLIFVAWSLRPTAGPNTFIDFAAYWSAGRLLLEGSNPYGYELLLELQRALGWAIPTPVVLWNPPWVMAILAPVSLLPFALAKWCWFAASAAALAISSAWCWRLYGGSSRCTVVSGAVPMLFFPCLLALYYGQITPFLLLAVVALLWALGAKRDLAAGFFLALTLVKPHVTYLVWPFLFLWLLRTRRWRIVLGAGVAFAALNITALCLRPSIYRDYTAALQSHYNPFIWKTPTLGSALGEAFAVRAQWISSLPLLGALVSILPIWRRWGAGFCWRRHLNFILLASVLTTVYAWSFDWVVLIPSVVEVLVWFEKEPRRNWYWVAGLAAAAIGFVLLQSSASHPVGILMLPLTIAILYTSAYAFQARREPADAQPGSA